MVSRSMTLIILFSTTMVLGACSEEATQEPAADDGSRYNHSLNMEEFMEMVLEPIADSLWQSAGWIDDRDEGYYELYPTTDEGWEAVRQQGAVIVEAGNALAVPGRARDNDAWLTYSQAMSSVGIQTMNAAAEQNEEDLFQAGAQLYSVCTACHQAYNPEMSRFFD